MVAFTVPNLTENFNTAYATGRERAKDRGVTNALAMAPTDPTGAQNALMRFGAVEEAGALEQQGQRRAELARAEQERVRRREIGGMAAGGDLQGAQGAALGEGFDVLAKTIGEMSTEAREAAEKNTNIVGGIMAQLATVEDDNERTQLGTAAMQRLIEQKILPPEAAENADFSRAAIIAGVAQAKDAVRLFESLKQPNAPSGYQWNPDGSQTFIRGGPADPAQVGQISGSRRDAVVSRPMPTRAGSGSGRAAAPAAPSYNPADIRWD